MGHSVELYVEYKVPGGDRFRGMGGRFDLFAPAILSKLGADSYPGFPAISEFRGMPSDLSDDVIEEYGIFVFDEAPDAHRCYSSEDAERWIASGKSTVLKDGWVSDPDYYWQSWLTGSEFMEAASETDRLFIDSDVAPDFYTMRCIASMMKTLINAECEVRAVYWFCGLDLGGK